MRLAEGGPAIEGASGISVGAAEPTVLNSAALSPAAAAHGASLSELEREKELTAMLERAVMSC